MIRMNSYLLMANMTMRAIRRSIIGIIMPTRNVVLSGSVVISADHLDSRYISLVVYALILNLIHHLNYNLILKTTLLNQSNCPMFGHQLKRLLITHLSNQLSHLLSYPMKQKNILIQQNFWILKLYQD